ncbi:helix-turn-helix domain-containing protein [Acidicapsa ligni]|uniref:helix-turn-helix domain-containing protein n=1 Tax=Acidicapsa ligni TaxID=542300 RepID=UPI0021DF9538|nr:helix-turn-helix transcriptional regulator [Acidicapsa ligni]
MVQTRKNTVAPLDSLRAIIREKRQALNLTQEQLAFLTGYDRTYVNMLERGKRNPSFTAILNICSVLRILPSAMVRTIEQEAGFEFITDKQLAIGLIKKKQVARFRT